MEVLVMVEMVKMVLAEGGDKGGETDRACCSWPAQSLRDRKQRAKKREYGCRSTEKKVREGAAAGRLG